MYNRITEEKIKDIPSIGDIDIERLPQELTKIYAQIVSLRRQFTEGRINFEDENLRSGLILLRKLSNNLETILLTIPDHQQRSSIAFVAGTANSLIYKISKGSEELSELLEIDTISPLIASCLLFLIGNSQADAAEISNNLKNAKPSNLTQQRLLSCVVALATGNLSLIVESQFNEEELIVIEDMQQLAINYLWRELGLGLKTIADRLTKQAQVQNENIHFNNVINLATSDEGIFSQKSIFTGPYRLAKLLKIAESDILERGVIDIPVPPNVDSTKWNIFLEKLAEMRPYLWENHKDAINTNFLFPGVSSVLTLPTGAGKSTLSELKIASCLYSGKKAIYLVPTNALKDQVDRNLRNLFDDYDVENVEFEGEFTEFGRLDIFPILVMTPERCLTLMNIKPELINNIGLVVFDEFHLIHGTDIKKERRSIDAMYCLISLFTVIPSADFLLISAMVENGEEIKDWVSSITGRECLLFNSSWKPTRQLHGCLVFEQSDIEVLKGIVASEKKIATTKTAPAKIRRAMTVVPYCFFSLKNIWETTDDSDYFKAPILDSHVLLKINDFWSLTSNRNEVAANLAINFAKQGLKTLIFVDDPKVAYSTSQKISKGIINRTNNYGDFIDRYKEKFDLLKLELGDISHSYFANGGNVGLHHGLLFPLERILIEDYFKERDGAIALVATATLAQGINLPAEMVIIAGDDRFDEDNGNRLDVKPHDLLNAAGRAGRAGQSSQGAVILIPGNIVTIQGSNISNGWWNLKDKVFSKGDQCLIIEDPLEYFLDSLQTNSETLNSIQVNILYKFKSENLSESETKNLLSKSFYAHKSVKDNSIDTFNKQVENLLKHRNDLDNLSENVAWAKEISFKTGIDPGIVFNLGEAIETENVENLIEFSVTELIDWFFRWLQSDRTILERLFSKPSTISQIKRATGLKPDKPVDPKIILDKIDILSGILKQYIIGLPLNELDEIIPNAVKATNVPHLLKARNFVIRLVPELSYVFGLFSMVIIEKATQIGIAKDSIPWNIRALSSCIREGFDNSEKLFYKQLYNMEMRVEVHSLF